MKLYVGLYSGYSQKVRIALAEKGLSARIPCVEVAPEAKRSPEYLRRNPLGLVPTLELDDGTHLPESTAIIEYLDALHPDPPLLPVDPLRRARMHALDRYNDQALTPPVRQLWGAIVRVPAAKRDAGVVAEAIGAIDNLFRYIETVAPEDGYLVGPFSIADIAFMQRLQALPMLGYTLPVDCPRVRAWDARLRARPSWDATMYSPLPEPG